jgi:predicted N-acetyltransferase YhbS
MTDRISIRTARRGEADRIADIELDAVQKYRDVPGMERLLTGLVTRAEKYVPLIAEERVFVAVNAHDWPVGFAATAEMDGEAYLAELDVECAHQGRGIGWQLVEACIAWARARGYASMLLSTFVSVPWNAPYYARRGFRAVPPTDLSKPGIAAQRAHEAEFLDLETRIVMRKVL